MCHILANLLTVKELKGYEEETKTFLNILLDAQANSNSDRSVSSLGFSYSLMYLLKSAETLTSFVNSNGLHMYLTLHQFPNRINALLAKEREDKQVCYNLLTCVWIITFRKTTRPFFENRQNEFVENVIKVLQLHGNEKIVRIILYIFKVLLRLGTINRVCLTAISALSTCWIAIWTKKSTNCSIVIGSIILYKRTWKNLKKCSMKTTKS